MPPVKKGFFKVEITFEKRCPVVEFFDNLDVDLIVNVAKRQEDGAQIECQVFQAVDSRRSWITRTS